MDPFQLTKFSSRLNGEVIVLFGQGNVFSSNFHIGFLVLVHIFFGEYATKNFFGSTHNESFANLTKTKIIEFFFHIFTIFYKF